MRPCVLCGIENGLKNIRESENILAIKSQQGLEVPEDSRRKIQDDISAIGGAIRQYQDEIQRLKENSKIKSAEFKKRLSAMQRELNEKMSLITDYRNEGMNAVNEIQEFYCLPLKDIQDYENIKGSLKPNEIYVYSNVEKVKEKTLSKPYTQQSLS